MTTNVYCEEKYVDCPAIRERLTELRVGTLVPDSPKISIVIPAYNISAFVRETLDSVFAQRFTNFEAIIVNDGSPDTAELEKELEPFFDRIVYAVPSFLGVALISSAFLIRSSWIYDVAILAQSAFYLLALVGFGLERAGARIGVFAIPHYFVLANLASVLGFYKFLRGERYANWEPIRDKNKEGESVSTFNQTV